MVEVVLVCALTVNSEIEEHSAMYFVTRLCNCGQSYLCVCVHNSSLSHSAHSAEEDVPCTEDLRPLCLSNLCGLVRW